MTAMTIVHTGFDEKAVLKTAEEKSRSVWGESFIIDWSVTGFEVVKRAFEDLTRDIGGLLGSAFVPQKNHHSTILSRILAPYDMSEWKDPAFARCKEECARLLPAFHLKLDAVVLAPGGTIQLVLRDAGTMPQLRMLFRDLGATVKAGTIDDDRMNTCTTVLGYLRTVPVVEDVKAQAGSVVHEWLQRSGIPDELPVHTLSLVRYLDTSLNVYVTLERF